MVWIQDVAFVRGSGSGPGIEGQFPKKGVILINFNYRLLLVDQGITRKKASPLRKFRKVIL